MAFQLDKEDNLQAINGYLCSFFPIKERKICFIVHGDFIVQAGRVALLQNKWNRWMAQKASEIAETSFYYFQQELTQPKWLEQSLSIFQRREAVGDVYEDVLEEPLDKAIRNPMVRTVEGNIVPLDRAVRITEEVVELVKNGLIKSIDLESIFEEQRYLIRKDYPIGGRAVRELKIDDLNRKEFLERKLDEGKAIDFLIRFYPLYKKAKEQSYSHYKQSAQETLIKDSLGVLLVVDQQGNIRKQEEVWIEPESDEISELKGKELNLGHILSGYNLIDKRLGKEAEKYLPKVKKITKNMIVEEAILPKLKTETPPPTVDEIKAYSCLLKSYKVVPEGEIWVLDAAGKARPSSDVFLSDKYNPLCQRETLNLPEMDFLSVQYLKVEKDPNGWREFFEKTDMKGYSGEDYYQYIKGNILPSLNDSEKIKNLSDADIICYTRIIVESALPLQEPIFVLTKEGTRKRSDSEVYLSSKYSPKEVWEKQSIISLDFVSEKYVNENDDPNKWKEFFKAIGVRESASREMMEEFGKTIVRRKFEKDGYIVNPYGGKYDLQAKKNSEVLHIEVRSTSAGNVEDISFDSERAKFIQEQGQSYYLVSVINIPDAPYIYCLKDPASREGVKFKMCIPKDTIEAYSEKTDAKHLI